jgi:hypothetical protein
MRVADADEVVWVGSDAFLPTGIGAHAVEISQCDFSTSEPRLSIPPHYNAAHDLLVRNLRAGRGGKVAYIDDTGSCSYRDLSQRANRFACSLVSLGVQTATGKIQRFQLRKRAAATTDSF